ncbi:actin-binding Rho-activating protein-like isoform X1 [Macrobrachium rosenbergii]|uniref:actin-binding Rho-activating protein-like isoform X1 n=1 Tax=Macrobrachium rosenbergii TaxID=79674 RepID=UPI0034D56C3C
MGDASQIHFLRSGNLAHKKAMLGAKAVGKVPPKSQQQDQLDSLLQQSFNVRRGSLADKLKMFDDVAKNHQERMANNPFHSSFDASKAPRRLSKDDPNYGKPVAGSLSEKRGLKAAKHVNAEVVLLCDMIYQEGQQFEDGTAVISFGELFQIYTRISNKVVGMLLRARKHGLLDFEGETLFQRRDDDVPITLLKPIKAIRDELNADKEFEVGICHKATE